MRAFALLLLTSALVAVAAEPALAQMGGGGMGGGGMGGGGMGGSGGGGRSGGHGHRGQGQQSQSQSSGAPNNPNGPRPPATIPVAMRLTGMVIVNGTAKTLAHGAVAAAKPDMSAIYAERSAQLSLDTVDLTGAGDVSLISDSRDSGLDSTLLIASQSSATVNGGTITTTGKGANAAFVSDAGSRLTLKNVTIVTRAAEAYGVEAAAGADLTADALTITTGADRAVAVAVQSPNSHATVTGGSFTTNGAASNIFYVAGALEATGVKAVAHDADAISGNGARALTLTDSTLSGDGYGAMLYASSDAPARHGPGGGPNGGPGGPMPMDGPGKPLPAGVSGPAGPASSHAAVQAPMSDDAPLRNTRFTMTGGSLSARHADFYVTNLHADIVLDHVALKSEGGILVKSAADQWGPLGRNGGDVHLDAHNQNLNGDFATDVISSILVSLSDHSALTGKTTPNTDVVIDATSTWTLTDDTNVGKLTDAAIVGDTVPNITGNGHTLTYDHRHNPALANKTYQLAGGGQLVPGGL